MALCKIVFDTPVLQFTFLIKTRLQVNMSIESFKLTLNYDKMEGIHNKNSMWLKLALHFCGQWTRWIMLIMILYQGAGTSGCIWWWWGMVKEHTIIKKETRIMTKSKEKGDSKAILSLKTMAMLLQIFRKPLDIETNIPKRINVINSIRRETPPLIIRKRLSRQERYRREQNWVSNNSLLVKISIYRVNH